MKKRSTKPVEVININKLGVRFRPSDYVVSKDNCPELYSLLAKRRGN